MSDVPSKQRSLAFLKMRGKCRISTGSEQKQVGDGQWCVTTLSFFYWYLSIKTLTPRNCMENILQVFKSLSSLKIGTRPMPISHRHKKITIH